VRGAESLPCCLSAPRGWGLCWYVVCPRVLIPWITASDHNQRRKVEPSLGKVAVDSCGGISLNTRRRPITRGDACAPCKRFYSHAGGWTNLRSK
jgi:hypothetical protein